MRGGGVGREAGEEWRGEKCAGNSRRGRPGATETSGEVVGGGGVARRMEVRGIRDGGGRTGEGDEVRWGMVGEKWMD